MFGLDDRIADLAGASGPIVFVVALLLGLRHATDPDHLTAVSTLVLAEEGRGMRLAGILGLFWGLGHAATLFAFGLPVVLFGHYLPEAVQRAAEVTVGALIVALAARLLIRWRRGAYHIHPHTHGTLQHAHPHAHERAHEHARGPKSDAAAEHAHPHAEGLGRSPLASFGIGLVHGVGGSAGAGVLLVAATSDRLEGVVALSLFAAGTAASMALVSCAFGYALVSRPVTRRLIALVPLFGALSLLFGVWYALGALDMNRR